MTGSTIEKKSGDTVHSFKITPEIKADIKASGFHPFADYQKGTGKAKVEGGGGWVDKAAKLDSKNPVRYVGDQMGFPLFQQDEPGVGSFMVGPGESLEQAFARAKARYDKK